jgi:hypothetical protein
MMNVLLFNSSLARIQELLVLPKVVQCKNYTNSIKIEDLSGFFFIMSKHINKIGEIYYTNKLSKKILLEYENDNRIKLIKKEFELKINDNNNIKLYDYQQNIIKLAEEYYKNNNSSILSLPCGTTLFFSIEKIKFLNSS